MNDDQIIDWLLDGDVAIQYQVHRDLLRCERPDLKARIATEGWGAKYLSFRQSNGHWGLGFYQPKWISSHYTLLDLKNLCISNENMLIRDTIRKILSEDIGPDGGINPSRLLTKSDVCINGMFLNYASYFGASENELNSIVDFILSQQLPDGGFNCQFNRKGATHSSMHSTISVIEGIRAYYLCGYNFRIEALLKAEKASQKFLLEHRLYQSHQTGKTIDQRMLMLSYPSRWRYDILRALDYFRLAGVDYDDRMADALDVLIKKRRTDNTWPLQCKHSGQAHFDMEKTGKASRWNTLRALRVLKHFQKFKKIESQVH